MKKATSAERRMVEFRNRRRAAGEPIETLETVRKRMRAYRARLAILRAKAGGPPVIRKPKGAKPFMGIDGEGCGQDRKGRQHYMLICAGNGDRDYELYTGKPLGTYEILDFICNLPADVILSGFAFGYDVTMILHDLPATDFSGDEPKGKRHDILADKKAWNSDLPFYKHLGRYTYWRDFGFEYLPHNYFRVCRVETTYVTRDGIVWPRPRPIKGSARTIYEGFGFFQRKFAHALQDFQIGTLEDRDMIARNKAERASFTRMTREVRDYCALECELHAAMMEKFRANCLAAGIKPRTWNGPGKLATVLHKSNATMPADRLATWVKSGVLQHADAAYYGGRFELPRIGRLPPLWEYDICSAYPAAMLELPCLEHGQWRYCSGAEIRALHASDPTVLYVASVAYQHTIRAGCKGVCGLPHRQTGREASGRLDYAGGLAWPLQGAGTYWSVELRSAEQLGARFRFGPGWAYATDCDCKPFAWIEPLYQERKRLDLLHGKNTQGYPIKLAINSLYGKLAQRVGSPQFANAIWAGLITAITRARLNRAMAQAPESIAMIATDGLYSVKPLDLPLGDDLGQWEMKPRKAGLFTVQPGLYWPLDRGAKPKTRGVSAGFFTRPRRRIFEQAWQKYHASGAAEPPTVALPIRLFIGMTLAEARGNSDLAGRWEDTTKDISFDWHGKRSAGSWRDGPHIATRPLAGGPDWISASYDAEPLLTQLGDLAGAEFEDQPDFVQLLDES